MALQNGIAHSSKITLHGGLVGNVALVLIVLIVAFSGIALLLKDILVTIVIVCLVVSIVFVCLWKIISFAGNHPDIALLEGNDTAGYICKRNSGNG